MLYSRWHSAQGQYEVFEGPDIVGLNDDLPVPSLPQTTQLGVPSVEAGRSLPASPARVGMVETAQGLVVPSLRFAGVGATSDGDTTPWLWLGGGVLIGSVVTWWMVRR